jgi:lipoprotein-anchoring transpeptidase ErfK/SrfK
MVTLHGHAGSNGSHTAQLTDQRIYTSSLWTQLWFVTSILLAAAAGALAVNIWKPSQAHTSARPAIVVAATAIPTIPIAPVRAITLDQNGHPVPNGAWIGADSVSFRIALTGRGKAVAARVEAEIVPAGLPFAGQPNVRSASVPLVPRTGARVSLTASGLADGLLYHWRMRTVLGTKQIGPWQSGGLFGVSTSVPLPPVLAASNVNVGGWTRTAQPRFRWVDGGGLAPTEYYEYRVLLKQNAGAAQPDTAWQRTAGHVLMLPKLADGSWSLEVRAVDMAGNTSLPARWAFQIQRTPPASPAISASYPEQGATSNVLAPTALIAAPTSGAPIAKVQYSITYGDGRPAQWHTLNGSVLTLRDLADGDWTAWVRDTNVVGEVSVAVPWHFVLDRQRPLVTSPKLSAGSFTEPLQSERVALGIGKAATVSYQVYAVGAKKPLATQTLGLRNPGPIKGLSWNGKTGPKTLAPQGKYYMVIRAVDPAGNATEVKTAAFSLLSKRIFISVSKEALWAYDGSKQVTYTLVTNGGPDTPTVPGTYHVEWKAAGLVMHSPWPKSSPLYYAPSKTNFALLYNANGGYYLHDAPWRWHFGPGSNSVAGQPGGSYTGTHGCTNIPFDVMEQLFNWADVGTLITIVA